MQHDAAWIGACQEFVIYLVGREDLQTLLCFLFLTHADPGIGVYNLGVLDPFLQHLLQDFVFFRRFSYGCKQLFSRDRWAITGEAGVFLDPFYSPGSDFIAIANTYITDLVARDLGGEPIAPRAAVR